MRGLHLGLRCVFSEARGLQAGIEGARISNGQVERWNFRVSNNVSKMRECALVHALLSKTLHRGLRLAAGSKPAPRWGPRRKADGAVRCIVALDSCILGAGRAYEANVARF